MIKKILILLILIIIYYNFKYLRCSLFETYTNTKIGLITRCKNEKYISTFVDYYLNEGVDNIFIIDDDSNDKSIYDKIISNKNVKIYFSKNIIVNNVAQKVYDQIKNSFEWMIYVDVDEYITTKKNKGNTIKEELLSTFKNADCIQIPWVMMSFNSIPYDPDNLLESNTYRWNHNERHVNKMSSDHKFRCRYEKIEVKCIFKTSKFDIINDHSPKTLLPTKLNVVDGVKNKKSYLGRFYKNLREDNIDNGYLLCYHYRLVSLDHCKRKILENKWYRDNNYDLIDLMSNDYPELKDDTLKNKIINSKLKFVHITKTGGTTIENVGLKNNLFWGKNDKNLKGYGGTPPFWHSPLRDFKKYPYDKNVKLFTVVRNPYDRVVSECFCKWGGRYIKGKILTKKDFNYYIRQRLIKLKRNKFHHFKPQYKYIYDKSGKKIVSYILKFENLNEEFKQLMQKYGLNIELDEIYNKSDKKFTIDDIDKENIVLINNIYDKDFKIFGYKKILI